MNSKQSRDSKDPAPSAGFTARRGFGGNDPGTGGEKVGSGTAERVSVASRFDKNKPGPAQPVRSGQAGNTPVSQAKEDHGQRKAEYVKASQRF